MNILVVSAEASPLAKVGGLADVAGALPKEFAELGHDARLVMPAYPMIVNDPKYNVETVIEHFEVPVGENRFSAFVKKTEVGGVTVFLVGSDQFFQEATESKKIYVPGAEPYVFFSRAVLEFVKCYEWQWKPNVIHCNDWHTGLVSVYLKTVLAQDPQLSGIGTVFTIHNLAYQGEFDRSILGWAGLPDYLYNMNQLEAYGNVNFLKGGLVFSDLVNTVSEKYAQEIQTPEYGARLEGLLQEVASKGRLRGILNGLDYHEFNSMTDRRIRHNYGAGDVAGKRVNKVDLQKEVGLPESPDKLVFGLISRLVDQKGLDLLKDIMPRLMRFDVQFVLLGSGDPIYEAYFEKVQKSHPDKMHTRIGFDANLAQKIYAGCDIFLMPSRFEPCGLGQMISLRYGTVPVVRATGGLADTIEEFDPKDQTGNGFVFTDYDSGAFFDAVKRSISTYRAPAAWEALVNNAMACDFSCRKCASEYIKFYQEAIDKATMPMAA